MHRGSERDVGGLSAAALSPCGSFDPYPPSLALSAQTLRQCPCRLHDEAGGSLA